MRNLFYFILFSFAFVSCDDYLNVESEKSVTYLNYFKNESEVEALLIPAMGDMRLVYAPYYLQAFDYVGLYTSQLESSLEGFKTLSPKTYWGYLTQRSSFWGGIYNTIGELNVLLDNAHRFENITSERKAFWVAEANFNKAMCYYRLARNFGEAPIVPSSETIDAIGKSSAKEVMEEVIRCAKAALILPKYGDLKDSSGKSMASKQYGNLGSVHTLLANAYAWMAGVVENKEEYWKLAEEHASEVLDGRAGDYGLEPTIADLITNCLGSKRNSRETIYEIEIRDIDESYVKAVEFNKRIPGYQLLNYPYTTSDPTAISLPYADVTRISVEDVKKLYNEPGDVRLKEYWYNLGEVKYMGEDYDEEGNPIEVELISEYAFINKWREPILGAALSDETISHPLVGMDANRVIWRVADLYLLRAECRARLSDSRAVDDLNKVRNRAGLQDYNKNYSFEELRKEIFKERERELIGEGYRHDDIIRNGYYREVLEGDFKNLTEEDIKNGALYLPILSNAFSKNPLMKQNTYWLWHK